MITVLLFFFQGILAIALRPNAARKQYRANINAIKGKVDDLGKIPEDFEVRNFEPSAVAWDKEAFLTSDVGRQYLGQIEEIYKKGLKRDHELKTAQIVDSIRGRGLLEISQRLQTNFRETDFDLFVKGFSTHNRQLLENAMARPSDPNSRIIIDKFKRTARRNGFLDLEKTIELKFNRMQFKDFIDGNGYTRDYDIAMSDPVKHRKLILYLQKKAKEYGDTVRWTLWMDYRKHRYIFEASNGYPAEKAKYFHTWIKYNERNLFDAITLPEAPGSKEILEQSKEQLRRNGFDRMADLIQEDVNKLASSAYSV